MSVARGGAGAARPARKRNPTDRYLGCFSNVAPSPALDHLVRYLSTWSGTDKVTELRHGPERERKLG